jgi:prolyl-tRNA synthetase
MANKEITKRSEDFSKWYNEIIESAQLADYSPVKGCMVIMPYGYAIWENIQKVVDSRFKKSGVKNAYFPLFIPESFLKKEAQHVEGFAPEVAVVTHAGGKKLEEALIVRPTSETIIYDTFSKWIQSYRDLPLLINQWANVVRWELRTKLFLRTTEFLWQEGHTAHATDKEANDKALEMLEIYRSFAEDYLAMPVLAGEKSESERFAGALRTYTIEAMMQDGKALQSGTSHHLGQNFAKAFGVKFSTEEGDEEFVHQTSWGLSTRIIGGLIMTHSDDKGLVLPPKIAPVQVVIVPIWVTDEEKKKVLTKALEIKESFGPEVEVYIDDRDLRPGPRFFEWEKKGVPLRIEVGPKDIDSKSVVTVRRDTGDKEVVVENMINKRVKDLLEDIQDSLYQKALNFRKERTKQVNSWDEFKYLIEKGYFLETSWCRSLECEAKIKEETKATTRCIPFDLKQEKGKCIYCAADSDCRIIFGKAY